MMTSRCPPLGCSQLVHEAAARWKRFEGTYRDDITAIITFLPFLEQGLTEDDEPIEPEKTAETEEGDAQSTHVLVNAGSSMAGSSMVGSSMAGSSAHVLVNAGKQGLIEGGTGDEGQEGGGTPTIADFAARRLSVHNPYDGDWSDKGDGDEKEREAAPEAPDTAPDTAPLLAELPPPTMGPLSEA